MKWVKDPCCPRNGERLDRESGDRPKQITILILVRVGTNKGISVCKTFVFYLSLLLSMLVLAGTLTIPETHLIVKPSSSPNNSSTTAIAGSHIVISHAQIQQSGAKNLTELLQHISGIAMHSSNSTTSPLIGLRGFGDNGSANTVILLNGFPLENPDSSSVYLDMIPIDTLQSIQISPNSNSVLLGDGAVGGVINIVTKKPTQFMAGASLGAGSYEGNSQSVYLGNQVKQFYYLISADKLRTDNSRQHNNLNESNGNINLGYTGDTYDTDFSYHDGYVNQQYPGASSNPNNNQLAITHYDWYMLSVKHALNNNWEFNNHLGYQTATTDGYLFSNFTQSSRSMTIMPSITGTLPFANIVTTTGVAASQDQYHFNTTGYLADDSNKNYATYTHWVIPLKQAYSLSLGANAAEQDANTNNNNGTNHAFVTEQGLSYKPQNDLQFYLRRSGTYRFPKADETGEQNQLLNTQTGSSYETGVTWTTLKTLLQMQVYVIDLDNEIAFAASNPDNPTDQANRNLAPTRRVGFLAHAHYKLSSLLTLYGDFNVVNPYYRSGPFEGNTIPLVSKELGSLGIGYQFQPRWQWYLATLYTSSFYAAGDDLNQDRIGGYTVFNSNISYQYKAWRLSFKINNLLNKQYSTYTVFSPYVQSLSEYPAPGRNYWVSLIYAFN